MRPGRPSKYYPQLLPKLERLLLLGFTDTQLAQELHLGSEATLYNWRKLYPKVEGVFSRCRALAQGSVARNLYKRANGYSIRKKKVEKDGSGLVTKETRETQHYPPDVDAAKFILSRRQPQLWPGDVGATMSVSVVAGLPADTLEGLKRLAKVGAGFALPGTRNTPMLESGAGPENAPTVTDGPKNLPETGQTSKSDEQTS